MKMSRSDLKLEKKSSIESEPRTLSLEQLHYAREEARNVMNTKSLDEALGIFTEARACIESHFGLKPVLSIRQRGRLTEGLADESEEMTDQLAASDHLRLPPPFISRIRDIVTSPF